MRLTAIWVSFARFESGSARVVAGLRPANGAKPRHHMKLTNNYSVAGSLSTITFKCVVTSLCNLIGTMNSPTVLSDSCN